MTRRLEGRNILVTGAAGIAAAAARRITTEGASVFVASLDPDESSGLAEELAAIGGEAAWQAADLRDEASVKSAFTACVERFGSLDGAVAVVGGSGRAFGDGPLHEVGLAAWEATLALNLTTAFLTGREAVRAMLRNDPDEQGSRGSMVFVGSVLGWSPAPERFSTHSYATAKGAVHSLAGSMAAYYAPQGIRVNVVAPAVVRTAMAERAAGDPDVVAYLEQRQPLTAGLLEAEDVAGTIAHLLAPESRAITGQTIAVDGGWSVSG